MPIFANPAQRLSSTSITPNLTAGLTATDFAPLTKNVRLSAAQSLALIKPASGVRKAFPLAGMTRESIAFFGSHSDGATSVDNFSCSCNTWLLSPIADADGNRTGAYWARHEAKLVIKCGSHTGTAGAADVTSVEYFADTLTLTKSDESSSTIKGPATDFETANNEGTIEVYSATANDIAELMVRGRPRAEYRVFDFFAPLNSSDAATLLLRMNAIVECSNV